MSGFAVQEINEIAENIYEHHESPLSFWNKIRDQMKATLIDKFVNANLSEGHRFSRSAYVAIMNLVSKKRKPAPP